MEYRLTKGERRIIDYFLKTNNEPTYVNEIANTIGYDPSGVSSHCKKLVANGFLKTTTENCRDSRGIQTTCYFLNMNMDYSSFKKVVEGYTDNDFIKEEFFDSKFAQHFINNEKIMLFLQNEMDTEFTENELKALFKIVRISPSVLFYCMFTVGNDDPNFKPRKSTEDMFKGIIKHKDYTYEAILFNIQQKLLKDLSENDIWVSDHTKGVSLNVNLRIDVPDGDGLNIKFLEYFYRELKIEDMSKKYDEHRAQVYDTLEYDFEIIKQPVCYACGQVAQTKCYLCGRSVCEVDSIADKHNDALCKSCQKTLKK